MTSLIWLVMLLVGMWAAYQWGRMDGEKAAFRKWLAPKADQSSAAEGSPE